MDRLRFGTFLAPNIMPVYEAVADEVERRLGIGAELFVETDYEACTKDEDPVMRERLALGLVERFVPVDASSYDDIRTMLAFCEAAGFMEIR